MRPNHALQGTRPSHHCCNHGIPWAGSLSLGCYVVSAKVTSVNAVGTGALESVGIDGRLGGTTPIGRATCLQLDLNDTRFVIQRQILCEQPDDFGYQPPDDTLQPVIRVKIEVVRLPAG